MDRLLIPVFLAAGLSWPTPTIAQEGLAGDPRFAQAVAARAEADGVVWERLELADQIRVMAEISGWLDPATLDAILAVPQRVESRTTDPGLEMLRALHLEAADELFLELESRIDQTTRWPDGFPAENPEEVAYSLLDAIEQEYVATMERGENPRFVLNLTSLILAWTSGQTEPETLLLHGSGQRVAEAMRLPELPLEAAVAAGVPAGEEPPAGPPEGPRAEPPGAPSSTPRPPPAIPSGPPEVTLPEPAAPSPGMQPAAGPAPAAPGPPGFSHLAACWTVNPPQLSFKTSIYPVGNPPQYRYEQFLDGYGRRRAGRLAINPDSTFVMQDTLATNGDLCRWTGRAFVLEAAARVIYPGGISCESGYSEGADWRWESDLSACSGTPKNLRTVAPSPVPLARGAATSLGRIWVLRGADRWVGRWIRRGTSEVFDGEWRRDGARVATVVQITQEGRRVTATRTASSDGVGCSYEGEITNSAVQGTYTCTQQGQTYGPYQFSAAIVR